MVSSEPVVISSSNMNDSRPVRMVATDHNCDKHPLSSGLQEALPAARHCTGGAAWCASLDAGRTGLHVSG